jgi:hypothetical protein
VFYLCHAHRRDAVEAQQGKLFRWRRIGHVTARQLCWWVAPGVPGVSGDPFNHPQRVANLTSVGAAVELIELGPGLRCGGPGRRRVGSGDIALVDQPRRPLPGVLDLALAGVQR